MSVKKETIEIITEITFDDFDEKLLDNLSDEQKNEILSLFEEEPCDWLEDDRQKFLKLVHNNYFNEIFEETDFDYDGSNNIDFENWCDYMIELKLYLCEEAL